MKNINLAVKELQSICANNQIVGQGSCGIIYLLDARTLFKFNYKEFIDFFEVKDSRFNFRILKDITNAIEDNMQIERIVYQGKEKTINQEIRNAEKKQAQMKLNTLTKGFVYCNGYCVGYLLHNHKNMVNLYDYVSQHKLTNEAYEQIFNNIKKAVFELQQNNIYHYDLTTRNILFNPNTYKTQIIDFEDQIQVYDNFNKNGFEKMKQQLNAIETFLGKHTYQEPTK